MWSLSLKRGLFVKDWREYDLILYKNKNKKINKKSEESSEHQRNGSQVPALIRPVFQYERIHGKIRYYHDKPKEKKIHFVLRTIRTRKCDSHFLMSEYWSCFPKLAIDHDRLFSDIPRKGSRKWSTVYVDVSFRS